MRKIFTFFLALLATTALWASNVITYTASSKLPETEDNSYSYEKGLHVNAFNVAIISHEFADSIGTITFVGEVTNIGRAAFYYCTSLITITIPNSVTNIGNLAFRSCTALTSISIPNSVKSIESSAFYGCISLPVENNLRYADNFLVEAVDKSLPSYAIKDGTKWIGSSAFSSCKSLSSINIPNSVTSIGYSAFGHCTSLATITIPDCVTSIGNEAFYSCSSLSSITIPNNVISIGVYAFAGCSSLTSITIPEHVTRIGEGAFGGCNLITSVTWNAKNCNTYKFGSLVESFTFGNEVERIPDSLCSDMSKLTSISIPSNVISIGEYAFVDCSSLISIDVDAANTHYASVDGVLFNYAKDSLIQYPIGNTRIEYTIPNSVINIENNAFKSCSSLTSIAFPNSVTNIGDYAFYNCTGLTSIIIGNSVTSIGSTAFSGCTSLADIYCYNDNPPTTNTNTFNSVSKHCYIHVPAGSSRAYQMAMGWRDFYHFFEISELPAGQTEVGVTVTNNYATFSWPVNPTASSYTLEIKKDGVLFCSLLFNTMGQLVGMNFAPNRGSSDTSDAEITEYGYSFVINGLDENSTYDYAFAALDDLGLTLETKSGTFTTKGTTTALNQLTDSPSDQFTKIIKDGHLLILRDGKSYNAQGGEL